MKAESSYLSVALSKQGGPDRHSLILMGSDEVVGRQGTVPGKNTRPDSLSICTDSGAVAMAAEARWLVFSRHLI